MLHFTGWSCRRAIELKAKWNIISFQISSQLYRVIRQYICCVDFQCFCCFMSKYLCMAKLFFFVICQKEDRCSGQISLQSEERVANVWNMTVTVPEWRKSMKTIWQYRGLMKMKIENTSSNSRSGEMDSYLGFLFNDLMLSSDTLLEVPKYSWWMHVRKNSTI